MRRPKRPEQAAAATNSSASRVKAAFAFVTFLLIAIPVLFTFGGGRELLMPGPLASGHAAIKECQVCHTANGSGQLSWIQGLLNRDPHNDNLACLNCHTIDKRIAFYPHTATGPMLNNDLERLRTVAAATTRPPVATLRDIAFPAEDLMNRRINCAMCHDEHKGTEADITTISDAQCHSCHAVQFDRFDNHHPDFSDYPFERRQRIKFDHKSHFTKHYPESASKNEGGQRIPDTCAECHVSKTDRRHMDVIAFDEVCSSCHIDQITGVERAIGPKGIAFLSLPGLDLQTLNEKGAVIGEWPELSEAELSPFVALILGQRPEGEAMLARLRGLDLLDLTDATDEQITAVTQLAWSIKGLIYALLSGKASDVLGDLNASRGTPVNPLLIADLSANLPRDVIINAQIDWLPNLANEMLQRRATLDQQGSSWSSAISEQKLSAPVALETAQAEPGALANPPAASKAEPVRVAQAAGDPDENWTADVYGEAANGGDPGANVNAADALPDAGAPAAQGNAAPDFAPIESSVDTETWAEHGGWYRRDFAIYYRPAGHKDKFIYAWLNLTGPYSRNDSTNAASLIFQQLTYKDAQGQCIKCHSIDISGGGLNVNWAPSSVADKSVRFTKFVHEPHFAVMENDGCLTCHKIDREGDFAKTYEQGNPAVPGATFTEVKKDLCVDCHGASGGARQDCTLCHQYHVQEVVTPIIRTQLPRQ